MGKPAPVLSSELIRAARALLRWEQRDLASASSVSLPTIKRLESRPGTMAARMSTARSLRKALEAAGVEFIDENGGGPGIRLRKRQQKKGSSGG
jgi:predicted transcriptional regulator